MTTTFAPLFYSSKARPLLIIVLSFILSACMSIKLVSDYDEQIDKGLSELQKASESFLIKYEKAGRPPGALTADEQAFFDKVSVDLSSLEVRAKAQPKNEITLQSLDVLKDSYKTLAQLLAAGVAGPDHLAPVRNSLNTSIGAILKFELAKKRGESPASK